MPSKKILKVAYILGIIFGIIEICTIFLMLFGIISIIISIYIKNVSNMKDSEIENNKEKLFYLSILYAISSPISGIMALIFYISLERNNEKKIIKERNKK